MVGQRTLRLVTKPAWPGEAQQRTPQQRAPLFSFPKQRAQLLDARRQHRPPSARQTLGAVQHSHSNPPLFSFQNRAPSFLELSSTSRRLPGCAPAPCSHTCGAGGKGGRSAAGGVSGAARRC